MNQLSESLYDPILVRGRDGRYRLDRLVYRPVPLGKPTRRAPAAAETVEQFLARGGLVTHCRSALPS